MKLIQKIRDWWNAPAHPQWTEQDWEKWEFELHKKFLEERRQRLIEQAPPAPEGFQRPQTPDDFVKRQLAWAEAWADEIMKRG